MVERVGRERHEAEHGDGDDSPDQADQDPQVHDAAPGLLHPVNGYHHAHDADGQKDRTDLHAAGGMEVPPCRRTGAKSERTGFGCSVRYLARAATRGEKDL